MRSNDIEEASAEELRFIGFHEGYRETEFWGQPFKDWELSAVYIYDQPVDEHRLIVQASEVENVIFMDYDMILKGIMDGSLPNCIFPEEFKLIKKALEPEFSVQGKI